MEPLRDEVEQKVKQKPWGLMIVGGAVAFLSIFSAITGAFNQGSVAGLTEVARPSPSAAVLQVAAPSVEPSPSPSPSPVETPTPTPTATPKSSVKPVVKATSKPSVAAAAQTTGEVKYYENSAGNTVQSPTHYDSKPNGATAQCNDGTYSFSQSRRGTCSGHGGVATWF